METKSLTKQTSQPLRGVADYFFICIVNKNVINSQKLWYNLQIIIVEKRGV